MGRHGIHRKEIARVVIDAINHPKLIIQAVASPIPEVAPVMNATFPSNLFMMIYSC